MIDLIFDDFVRIIGRKIARNVMAMATGEVPAEVAAGELAEMPEIIKKVQEAVCAKFLFQRPKEKKRKVKI